MNTDVKEFVRRSLEQGATRLEIASALRAGHWDEDEIQEGLSAFAEHDFSVPVPRKTVFAQPKEAFLYIVSFIGLYLSALSLGSLMFSFINRWFPDALTSYGYGIYESAGRELLLPLASLIIAFPLYAFLTRGLLRSMKHNPERRRSSVGKWLTYATLVVASLTVAGDLIAVLASLLGGEITVRFILKALVVLILSGVVFGFYLTLARTDEVEKEGDREQTTEPLFLSRPVLWAVIALVVASVVYGLMLVGTPQTQRGLAFDQRRVSDLQQISYGVNSYWETTGTLPQSIDALASMPYFMGPVRDPDTRLPYEYRVTGEKTYELCAEFAFESVFSQYPRGKLISLAPEEAWSHGAGRWCFAREVLGKAKESVSNKQ
ncbi:MAG: hypothetical protein HYS76_01405 [Candidatus Wildermuthbacteria bacterium]|nr:hypothetical protein [Candidatus Wildermuthbacteria bacterium]